MASDKWWRGYDEAIAGSVAAGARVLDVGCGDGGLVDRLVSSGLDAVGVDPRAPQRDRLVRERVEDFRSLSLFDAACAFMVLHHADLDAALPAIASLLLPAGRLFAYEFAWEAFDERAASWLASHDGSGADNSVTGWRAEHDGLHTSPTLSSAISKTFQLQSEAQSPYLARMLGRHDLEPAERAMIESGDLPALGRWYVAVAHT